MSGATEVLQRYMSDQIADLFQQPMYKGKIGQKTVADNCSKKKQQQ